MSAVMEFYIGQLKLDLFEDAYVVEVSFVDKPPCQNKVKDLPAWALSSRHAIWFFQNDKPIMVRAEHGESIREDLAISFLH